MKACSICGTSNADDAEACQACGRPLPSPLARTLESHAFRDLAPTPPPRTGTMVGLPENQGPPEDPVPPAPPPNRNLKQTLLGGVSPIAPQQPTTGGGLKRTMLGMAAPVLPDQPNAVISGNESPSPTEPPRGSLKRTMLGVAPPDFATARGNPPPEQGLTQEPGETRPANQAVHQELQQAQIPPITQPGQGPTGPFPNTIGGQQGTPPIAAPLAQEPPGGLSKHRTMLGVAMPGIAPINPGYAKPPPIASSSPPGVPAAAPLPEPLTTQAQPPRPVRASKGHRGAVVLIAVAVVLLAGTGLFAWLWEAPRPIAAEVNLDETGREQLALRCENCPDQTQVKLDGATAHFQNGRANLALKQPLTVGTNHLTVNVERPGMGRDEQVALSVPIEYRVAGDFSGLSEDPPILRIRVEAQPGTRAVVDGSSVSLDSSGKGVYTIDVSKEITGTADEIVPLERKVPYAVTSPEGAVERGEVTLRVGIVPLRIDAPGPRIVIDEEHFKLVGQTLKDGVVTVSGRPITVDAQGHFSQLMNVSSVGQTTITVVASAENHAPRKTPIVVKRVDDLEAEARDFRRDAVADYGKITSKLGAAAGKRIAFTGRVIESRWDGATIALLDIESGCEESPCLARLVYGARLDLKPESVIRLYGTVARVVEGPRTGSRIPELRADFVLHGTGR